MRLRALLLSSICFLIPLAPASAWAGDPCPTPLLTWGTLGSGPSNLDHPFAIELGPDGYLYVADQQNNRIVVFTTDGTIVRSWPIPGTGEPSHPSGLAITAAGIVYVSEHHIHRISKWSTTGTFLGFVALPGSGPGQALYPTHLSLDGAENLYVAMLGNGRVDKFSPAGAYLGAIGAAELSTPYGVEVDAFGNIYVGTYTQNTIMKFNPGGTLVDAWSPGLFGVEGIERDGGGNYLAADTGNNRGVMFDPAGAFLCSFGTLGSGLGQMYTPSDIAVDPDGNIYSCEWNNARIQKWRPPMPVPATQSTFGAIKAKYRR